MKQPGGTTFLIFGLAFLALVQAFLLLREPGEGDADRMTWLEAGDTLARVIATGPEGSKHSLAIGGAAILLVFSSDCVHCSDVAPLWKAWTHGPGPKPRAVALTSEPLESALAYVAAQGWGAKVWSVTVDSLDEVEHALMGRIPRSVSPGRGGCDPG